MDEILNSLGYLTVPQLTQLQGIIAQKIKIKREINALAAKLNAAT